MSKLLLSFFLLLPAYAGFTQKIHFTDASNSWKVGASGKDYMGQPFSASYHYYYSGDTLIKGLYYKRLASYSNLLSGQSTYPRPDLYFVREDTLAGKVWCRNGG